jgi:hypothetical protein
MAPPIYAMPKPAKTSELAIASLALGSCGMLASVPSILLFIATIGQSYPATTNAANAQLFPAYLAIPAFLLCVAGVICGHSGLVWIKRSKGAIQGRALAIWGLTLSYVPIVSSIVFVLYGIVNYNAIMNEPSSLSWPYTRTINADIALHRPVIRHTSEL